MEIWQGIGILASVLAASRFAVRSRLRKEEAADLAAFNADWQEHQQRFIEEARFAARF